MEENNLIKELSVPIFQAKGWMKLLGVMMIIYGAILALTLVGIIICWLPIWLGILLFRAAGAVEGAQLTGEKGHLLETLRQIKTFFVINGVLMLVGLIATALSFLFAGGAMLAMMDSI